MENKKLYEKARADVFKQYKAKIRQLERDVRILDDKNTALVRDLYSMELKDDSLQRLGNVEVFQEYNIAYALQIGMLVSIEDVESLFSVPKEILKKLFKLTSDGDGIYKS